MNKRRLAYYFVIIGFIVGLSHFSPTYAATEPVKTINVVMDENYPPFSFRDSVGKLQGITIDQWSKFQEVTGIKVNITGMVWNKATVAMKEGKYDVIDTISFNSDRAKVYDFTEAYATIDVPIFFDKSITGISNVKSLKGFVVGAKKSDNCINVLKQNGITNIIEYETAEDVVKAVKQHKIRIFVMGKYPAMYFMFKLGIQDEFNYASSLYTSQFFRAIKKGNPELLNTINDGFSKISAKDYKVIEQRWFGKASVNGTANLINAQLFKTIVIIVISVSIIVLLLFIWNRSLRNKVNKKTLELSKTIEELNNRSKELMLSEEKFRTIFEMAPIGISLNDLSTLTMQITNQRYADIVGRTIEEITNESWVGITVPEDVQANIDNLNLLRERKVSEFSMNKRYRKPDGSIVWVNIKNVVLNSVENESEKYICMVEDITERKQAEEVLRASENTFRTLFEGSSDPILIMDNCQFIDCNPAALEALGYDSKDFIVGKSPWELSPEIQPDGQYSEEKARYVLQTSHNSLRTRFEWWHKKSDGTLLPVDVKLTTITLHEKKVLHVLWRDISVWKDMEEKLAYLSYHDQLTELYNRRFFEEELRRLDVDRNYPLTILMGDVNGLKLVNDSFGHMMGDELLRKVAQILRTSCRKGDIVARLGGDEFVILLPKADGKDVDRIVKKVKEYTQNETVGSIEISISLGYETKYSEGEDIHNIFNSAEDHMYKKKLFESPSMRGKTIKAIINTLHEKNKREEQHSHRVSELCSEMGIAMNLPEDQIEELKNMGLLHDIGKIAIDENILNKPGKLNEDEWEEIKRHPEIGYRILSTVNDMSEMAEYVLYHHEKWDGTGYPKGLVGEDIPIQSRIIAIVDAFDAMTSERSYRPALSEEVAINELYKNMNVQFDEELVKIFIKKVLNAGLIQ